MPCVVGVDGFRPHLGKLDSSLGCLVFEPFALPKANRGNVLWFHRAFGRCIRHGLGSCLGKSDGSAGLGIGVPVWRLPFELMAKAVGQSRISDRLEFAFALGGVIYVLARFYFLFSSNRFEPSEPFLKYLWGYLGLFPTVLFPPFLALCSTRFLIYEEVVAYGFIAGLLLMAGSAWLWLRPNLYSFFALALFCGFTPLIRPPIGVYGMASVAVAGIGMWKHGRQIRVCFVWLAFFIHWESACWFTVILCAFVRRTNSVIP